MTKTILFTGATDGIGLAAAKLLASEGHTLLLHGRNAEKLEAAKASVGGASETFRADLSSMGEVDALAKDVLSRHHKIDVLVNNAGVLKAPNPNTGDGLDVRFAVNTLAPYILSRALLPALADDGRIVNLSSAAQAPVDVALLEGRKSAAHMDAYAQSKLALVMWTQALAEELKPRQVAVSVNPGSLLATNMVREGFGIAGNDLSIGADILVRAATSEEFAKASGKYFDNDAGRFAPPHADAQNMGKVKAVMAALDTLRAKLAVGA